MYKLKQVLFNYEYHIFFFIFLGIFLCYLFEESIVKSREDQDNLVYFLGITTKKI